jgi:hypothetical protein
MKFLFSFIFSWLFCFGSTSQGNFYPAGRQHHDLLSMEAIAPALLAQQLTLPFKTEREKISGRDGIIVTKSATETGGTKRLMK